MAVVAPLGPVYQAGTLSGNPLATAAGLAALDHLDAAAYAPPRGAPPTRLADGLGRRRARRRRAAGGHAGRPVLLADGEPARLRRSAKRTDTERFGRFFHAMLRRGVALAPGAYEILFPGLAHTDEVVDEVLAAARRRPVSSTRRLRRPTAAARAVRSRP